MVFLKESFQGQQKTKENPVSECMDHVALLIITMDMVADSLS